MSKLLELFDDFAKPVCVKHTLDLGHEAKNIILVIDDITKKAVFQYNLYDLNGNLYEVLSENEKELHIAIMEYLKFIRSTFFKHDPEPFFAETNWYIEQFIRKHIEATFYIPDLVFDAVNLDI